MLVNERIQDYGRGEHLCKFQKFSLAGDRSRGSSRLKISCVETKVEVRTDEFLWYNGQNKLLIAAGMTTDGERGRLILNLMGAGNAVFLFEFWASKRLPIFGDKN